MEYKASKLYISVTENLHCYLPFTTYENPLLMNNIIIHGHRPITVDVWKEMVHSNKNVINVDTGCVYLNMAGFGKLTAIELNPGSLYFA
jgi:serine/threonine protein phosphatase 1